jgi:hypothetical protein
MSKKGRHTCTRTGSSKQPSSAVNQFRHILSTNQYYASVLTFRSQQCSNRCKNVKANYTPPANSSDQALFPHRGLYFLTHFRRFLFCFGVPTIDFPRTGKATERYKPKDKTNKPIHLTLSTHPTSAASNGRLIPLPPSQSENIDY